VSPRITRQVRRSVFGRDPEGYDRARLDYPDRVFEILRTRCGLHRGSAVFEVGPGTGIATRPLLRYGADPLTLVEPDRRLARFLRRTLRARAGRIRIDPTPFERTKLPARSFDLGVAASSFHWTPERFALRKVARALKPGGWWASWNNHHGDPYRPSAFHRALQPLYRELYYPRYLGTYNRTSAERDRRRRLAALRSVGRFDSIQLEQIHWKAVLPAARVRALWATFSDMMILPPARRRWFLSEVERVANERFAGEVEIPMLTPVYTARRV
jgi:SAM-dependent methyltransferase